MKSRLLILSDSHGYTQTLSSILMHAESMGPLNGVIHLGDGHRDLDAFKAALPPVFQVCGNCDFCGPQEREQLIACFNAPLFITHGHLYQVKQSLYPLASRARELGAKAALFGHTHAPCNEDVGGLLLLNPGAACDGRFSILTIEENGSIFARMF